MPRPSTGDLSRPEMEHIHGGSPEPPPLCGQGGVLLNSRGELVGMNTAIYSPSGASAGVGFAIPADTVARVADRIIRNGQARPPPPPSLKGEPLLREFEFRITGLSCPCPGNPPPLPPPANHPHQPAASVPAPFRAPL